MLCGKFLPCHLVWYLNCKISFDSYTALTRVSWSTTIDHDDNEKDGDDADADADADVDDDDDDDDDDDE